MPMAERRPSSHGNHVEPYRTRNSIVCRPGKICFAYDSRSTFFDINASRHNLETNPNQTIVVVVVVISEAVSILL
jgi:hypothetical protein